MPSDKRLQSMRSFHRQSTTEEFVRSESPLPPVAKGGARIRVKQCALQGRVRSRSVPDAFGTKPFRYQKGRVRYHVTTSVPAIFGTKRYPVRYQYRFGTGSNSVPCLFRYQTLNRLQRPLLAEQSAQCRELQFLK